MPLRALCALLSRIGAIAVAVVWIAASRSAEANQPLVGVTQFDVGGYHACAVTAYGGAQCWRANFNGQLGNGRFETSLTASDVVALWTGVATVATGDVRAGHWSNLHAASTDTLDENSTVRYGIAVSSSAPLHKVRATCACASTIATVR